MISCSELCHFLSSGIAHIVNGILMFLLIERHLERQYGEHLAHITFDAFNTPLLPGPYLRRNIIVDRYQRILFQELGYIEIKAWIID